jgi:hypothetical protein
LEVDLLFHGRIIIHRWMRTTHAPLTLPLPP